MIRRANQFYVTTNQVGNCVAVTDNQFFGLARTLIFTLTLNVI